MTFEAWLRTVCFQAPTPEAHDLAKCAWDAALESVRSEARNSALEEAAKVCDHGPVGRKYAALIRALQSTARVAEGEIARLKSRVADAAKAWLIRYEDEVRDEAEEAPCKDLVAAVDALVAEEKDVHLTELRK